MSIYFSPGKAIGALLVTKEIVIDPLAGYE
jgi:hypothetical protein